MPNPTEVRPVLEMQHVSKRFDATQALEDVSLTLYPGEVHALIGENGAGKSTLVKILSGYEQATEGDFTINGDSGGIQWKRSSGVLQQFDGQLCHDRPRRWIVYNLYARVEAICFNGTVRE